MDNAINQATKEITQRYDFKGVKAEIKLDQKEKTVTLWCSEEGKLDALNDIFQNKLIKRGISLLSLDYQKIESAFGGSVRQVITIQAGISKEKGKEIIAAIKEASLKCKHKFKMNKSVSQEKTEMIFKRPLALLRSKQDQIKVPMQFGNFRD